ncbi:g5310 [Coccomyxa viridis]|uniref:G5310 protein n=1 Tax=Coccomyxa viridis TaxID=1274662 RepID=A0ABP1FXG5_9CHLO
MATASDGTTLTATAAPPSEERTESILNADSSAASAGNKADIKGGKKSKNRHLARMMRSNLASEAAAVRMFGVQSRLGGHRPDLKFFKEGEAELLERLQTLAPQYRTRPSALLPLIRATGTALGALSAVLPRPYSEAIKGGAAEALIEQYNDQLREIRERGLADTDAAEPLRELLRALRDQPRITEGSVKVPDVAELQRPQDVKLEEGLAGVVKVGFKNLLNLTSYV